MCLGPNLRDGALDDTKYSRLLKKISCTSGSSGGKNGLISQILVSDGRKIVSGFETDSKNDKNKWKTGIGKLEERNIFVLAVLDMRDAFYISKWIT